MTRLSREVLAELVAELGPRWQACQDARLADRPRLRAVEAGARHRPVFIDRLLAPLVHLRHGVTHDVLACRLGGVPVDDHPGGRRGAPAAGRVRIHRGGRSRLRTLADVVAHLGASVRVESPAWRS